MGQVTLYLMDLATYLPHKPMRRLIRIFLLLLASTACAGTLEYRVPVTHSLTSTDYIRVIYNAVLNPTTSSQQISMVDFGAAITPYLTGTAPSLATTPDMLPISSGTVSGTCTLSRAAGYVQKITLSGSTVLAVPTGGGEGSEIKVYITAAGTQWLNFSGSIHIPTDSGEALPKPLTGGKIYVVLLHNFGSFWGLQSLIGGY